MPSSTFFNLPEEKRQKILAVATKAFAEKPFSQVNVTNIIDECGIARGSFYQYFADLEDLYQYIILQAAEIKQSYLDKQLHGLSTVNIKELLRNMYIAGLKFIKDYRDYSSMSMLLMKDEASKKLKDNLLESNRDKADDYFIKLIRQSNGGKAYSEQDARLVAHLITAVNISFMEYYIDIFDSGEEVEIMELVDKLLDMIFHGFIKQ